MIDKLQRASFKGAFFYWGRLSTQLGKKSVSHNYPGSDNRFVEDMGVLPRIFTVDAYIAGGDDYFNNKDALEKALESPGPGDLIHPTYGRILVTAKPADCTEDLREMGRATYRITFEKSTDKSRPTADQVSQRSVILQAEEASKSLVETASDEWEIPSSADIAEIVTENVKKATDAIDDKIGVLSAVRADAFKVINSVNTLQDSVTLFVNEPMALFNSLKAVYDQTMNIDDFALQQLNRIVGFFGNAADALAGSDTNEGDLIKPISYETAGAEKNRVVMNEASNLFALINAYVALSKVDYTSTAQIDNYANVVEKQFEMMTGTELMSGNLRDKIIDLRNTANKLVDAKRIRAKEIVSLYYEVPIPLHVAMYQYTGSIEDESYTYGLNKDKDHIFAKGEIRLLKDDDS